MFEILCLKMGWAQQRITKEKSKDT